MKTSGQHSIRYPIILWGVLICAGINSRPSHHARANAAICWYFRRQAQYHVNDR